MVNHPNRSKADKAQIEMMQRIWSHQKDDPRGAMRVYITGNEPSHEKVLKKLMQRDLVVQCIIQLPRDAMHGVKLTESGLAAIGAPDHEPPIGHAMDVKTGAAILSNSVAGER